MQIIKDRAINITLSAIRKHTSKTGHRTSFESWYIEIFQTNSYQQRLRINLVRLGAGKKLKFLRTKI